ncbi:MAG: hypothetical protein KGJ36_02035 [Acidobacteriota bacterium]|nr:hypothetical protein [Acidobacteriota bacterium]
MDAAAHREVAVASYQRCWELLDQPVRSNGDDVELLTSAFTSRFHWGHAGGPQEWIIADWMVSRAAAAAGLGQLAVWFATRADAATDGADVPDWLRASTAEGVARAYGASGDPERRDRWIARAEALVAAIADEGDRELIAGQLASVPRA